MKIVFAFLMLAVAFCAGAVEYKLDVKSDKKEWSLKAGEKVTFSFVLYSRENAKDTFNPVVGRKVSYELMRDGGMKNIKKQFVTTDKPFTLTTTGNGPGWVCINFVVRDANGKPTMVKSRQGRKYMLQKGIGVMYDIDKLEPGQPEPEDFDAFWKAQREALNKVPLKAKLTPIPASSSKKDFKFWDVQIDCAGGMPVSGHLSMPADAKPKSLPAVLTLHGAGVSGSAMYTFGRSLHLDINAHGIPNRKGRAYYEKLAKTTLKDYRFAGTSSRDTVYFKGMYLRLMRALDYLKSRPEWDGKVLIATGGSQGGGQAIAAAALDPQVTLCVADVPAIGDHAGSIAKFPRRPGWPKFYDARNGKADPKVVAATAYYDNVFLARRIKCETYLSAGLMDMSCSPAGIYLVYKNLASEKKDITVYPQGTHSSSPGRKGKARINAVLQGK